MDKANDIIKSLQDALEKAKKGKSEQSNICTIIHKVREQMMGEFAKYKKDTEETVNKVLREMRDSLDEMGKEKSSLEEERNRMTCLLSQLQGSINELEGQVSWMYGMIWFESRICPSISIESGIEV